jgi:hypothetical protein
MKGYYKMPDATRNTIDEDGWLHSGDLVMRDENGNFRVTGRIKDMIIRGGENIYPKEIEDFLYTHPKIQDVQVIGVPDADYGEEILAAVILKPGEESSEEEIKQYVMDHMAKHKVPRYLSKLGDMPRLSRYHFEPSTLYYKGTGKQQPKVFAFYDKIADAEAKGMQFPGDMKEANLLRYEMRLNGRLPYQLSVPEVRAASMYEKPFYRTMIKRYQDSYFSISKLNQIRANVMSEIKTVSDAFSVFVARLISQTDNDQIRDFLDEIRDAGVFSDRKYYTRLKRKIQEVATRADISVSDELIREMDDEIRNCGAYL